MANEKLMAQAEDGLLDLGKLNQAVVRELQVRRQARRLMSGVNDRRRGYGS